jgi:hypothetical protein
MINLVDGLVLLHEQRVLHRNIRPETIFFDQKQGPSTFRLGGFEWSLRLGVPAGRTPPPSWSSPPEFFETKSAAYSPETDWFSLGILIARCMINAESFGDRPPAERHISLLSAIDSTKPRELSDAEKYLISQLILHDPAERLTRGHYVRRAMLDIIQQLGEDGGSQHDERPLILGIDPNNSALIEKALLQGYVPNPEKPYDPFNPRDPVHLSGLTEFIRKDLSRCQLYPSPAPSLYVANGGAFTFKIAPFEQFDREKNQKKKTWTAAFCIGLADLRMPEVNTAVSELRENSILVQTVGQIHKSAFSLLGARSWESVLPVVDRSAMRRASLSRFHEFVRCTNQLELLMRTGEIFGYTRIEYGEGSGGLIRTVIQEFPEGNPLAFDLFRVEGGMAEFLLKEVDSRKPNCRLVALDASRDLGLYADSRNKVQWWEIDEIDPSTGKISLVRPAAGTDATPPPQVGVLRTYGLSGQLTLVKRRKDAIDRLENHSYLLRSLSSPGELIMDTGMGEVLPVPISPGEVDQSKQAAIRDILGVRPIYALQGPPGTGKTTLVAHLIREILSDDPVAQILITAQAHGAVDVLRAKVDAAFAGVPPADRPLAIRLGASDGDEDLPAEGSVIDIAKKLLEMTAERMIATPSRTPLQEEWLGAVGRMQSLIDGKSATGEAADFCEIVKRGANLTYCTTSAGDLDTLAKSAQSFDWSIVEEAGRAHGCDLALPLQAGHRWLLIGDQKQLPPYRFRDYAGGLAKLDDAALALRDLPRARSLVDYEWIKGWRDRSIEQREEFAKYAQLWLNTFERIFLNCTAAFGEERITVEEPLSAAAGQLSRQHRMHPDIGNLVSQCYYSGKLTNETESGGVILEKVKHDLVFPDGIAGKAIAWLDLPWAVYNREFRELGPEEDYPRYINPKEVERIREFLESLRCDVVPPDPLEVAILSPYAQQVALINKTLGSLRNLSPGLIVKPVVSAAPHGIVRSGGDRVAHTVDGFQGNQADIVVASLVRNNALPPEEGLGFLKESQRLNVLLSRAERLLVLVGSWDFFEHQISTVPSEKEKGDLWHLKKAVEIMGAWFRDGKAIKFNWRGPGRI